MPSLASQFTLDSSSSTGRCNYPMFALGGAPVPTTVVFTFALIVLTPGAQGKGSPAAPGTGVQTYGLPAMIVRGAAPATIVVGTGVPPNAVKG